VSQEISIHDVFQHSQLITKRHRYEDVVAPPPDAA